MDLKWLKSLYPPDESLSSARANQLVKAMKGCISVSKSKTGEIIYRENRFEGQKLKNYSHRLDRHKVSVSAELGAQGRILMHQRKKIVNIRQRNDVKVPPELSASFRDPPDVLILDEPYDDDTRRLSQSERRSEEAPRRRKPLQPDPDSLVIMTVERENVKKPKKNTPRMKSQSGVSSVPDKNNFLHSIKEQEEEEGLSIGRFSPVPTYKFAPVTLPRIGQSHMIVTPRAWTPEVEEDSDEEEARDPPGARGLRHLRKNFDFTELRDMIQEQVVQDQVHQLNLLERNCVDERKVLSLKAKMSEQDQFRGLVSLRSPEKRRLSKLNRKRRAHKSLSFRYGIRLEGARPVMLRRNTPIT